jgi:preprotein translocase subunit SecB
MLQAIMLLISNMLFIFFRQLACNALLFTALTIAGANVQALYRDYAQDGATSATKRKTTRLRATASGIAPTRR